jgi:putative tricarboxylic transport membrane protein
MLAAFQRYNIQPGSQLFEGNATLVWALIASLYIGNVMLLVLNLPLVGMWVKLLSIPRPWLYSGILVFAGLGTWAQSQSVTGLVVLYALGIMGYVMRRFGIPVGPCVVGAILGPLAEKQFRTAMQINQNDWTVFFTRPLSLSIFVVTVIIVVAPVIVGVIRSRMAQPTA